MKRGMYYCGRMISEQYGTVFFKEHYEKIEKVYSIWICPKPARNRENSIRNYKIHEDIVSGRYGEKKENYDLLQIIILNLPPWKKDNQKNVLGLLSILLSEVETPEQKKKILTSDYNIAMTEEFEEEIEYMCNLSEAVAEKALREGMQKGIQKGIQKGTIQTLDSLVRDGVITFEEAAKGCDMSIEEFQKAVKENKNHDSIVS